MQARHQLLQPTPTHRLLFVRVRAPLSRLPELSGRKIPETVVQLQKSG
jgi:hypothetical protein